MGNRLQETLETLREYKKPFLAKYNVPDENPSCCARLKYALLCPPHGLPARYVSFVATVALFWAASYSVSGEDALPGGNLFSLQVLFAGCFIGGELLSFCRLPPLLGMLIVGCILKNVPKINVAANINSHWSTSLRSIALAIILIKAGLGLDPVALKKLSCIVLRLAFIPCIAECITAAIVSHFLLHLPWDWGFLLGFVLAAVSPAVVVPSLLNLQFQGYGVAKGIPTLVIAAASIDDVLAITGFGVVMGIAFSKGGLLWSILKGPLEVIMGIAGGIIGGLILWYYPSRDQKHLFLRCAMLIGSSLLIIFGTQRIEYPSAGPLGCLTVAFVAALRWRNETSRRGRNELKNVQNVVGIFWIVFQPLLFGLIGAEVNVSQLDGGMIGLGVATLCIGLLIRVLTSFLVVFGTDFNLKEKLFIPFAWLPKATVQAAIGAVALQTAIQQQNKAFIEYGRIILNLAVVVIIITAPVGAVAIALTGPQFLKKTEASQLVELSNDQAEQSIKELGKNDDLDNANDNDGDDLQMEIESENAM